LYGFCAIQGCSFPRTRIVSESYLRKRAGSRFGLGDEHVYEVTLLGAAKRGPGKVPDLMYAVTSHRPQEKIVNLVQWSATILSQSKNLFLGRLLCFLRYFDPALVELLYTGL
jgi:hypothetical protein